VPPDAPLSAPNTPNTPNTRSTGTRARVTRRESGRRFPSITWPHSTASNGT